MEEQKNTSKEVKMNVVKDTQDNKQQKLSYDDLNKICMELSQQNQNMKGYIEKLHRQIEEMGDMLRTKRLDYLFKVIDTQYKQSSHGYTHCFDEEFIGKCKAEIQDALTIPEQTEEAKEG